MKTILIYVVVFLTLLGTSSAAGSNNEEGKTWFGNCETARFRFSHGVIISWQQSFRARRYLSEIKTNIPVPVYIIEGNSNLIPRLVFIKISKSTDLEYFRKWLHHLQDSPFCFDLCCHGCYIWRSEFLRAQFSEVSWNDAFGLFFSPSQMAHDTRWYLLIVCELIFLPAIISCDELSYAWSNGKTKIIGRFINRQPRFFFRDLSRGI